MDEYQSEIHEIRQTLTRLQEADGDPGLIDEYEAELRNLNALYRAAVETLEMGRGDPRLRDSLSDLGFGEWTLQNVYAFVYDMATEIPAGGRDLASLINETDFAGSLLESIDGDEG